jgi:hypothetical protein
MKKLLYLLPLILVATACKEKKEDMMAKKWQAVKLSNPQMDQMIKDQEVFLDTFGRTGDATTNLATYGISNVDSMRESLQMQLNDFKAMQDHSVKNTWFNFRKDGVAIMNFSGQLDSTNWYFDDENKLILDEMKLKGAGNKIIMEVVELKETMLTLKFTEDGMTSVVTFAPDLK